jgi:hypothetical protein
MPGSSCDGRLAAGLQPIVPPARDHRARGGSQQVWRAVGAGALDDCFRSNIFLFCFIEYFFFWRAYILGLEVAHYLFPFCFQITSMPYFP